MQGVEKGFRRELSHHPLWRLTSRNGLGQRPEILRLQVAVPPPHDGYSFLLTVDYNITLGYGSDGRVLRVDIYPLRISREALARVSVDGDPASTYWAIRSKASAS